MNNYAALDWIVGTDTGISSKMLWAVMMGRPAQRPDAPADLADLGRCLRLLELVPEWKPRLGEMAAVSPAWAALIVRWHELATLMAQEVGIDWSRGRRAPQTYDLMKRVLRGAAA